MAAALIFIPGAMPSFDRNGNTCVAELYFYVNDGTYTPKNVYTSSALTTPHPFPVVSDASGVFPAMWADNLDLFTVVWATRESDPRSLTWNDIAPLSSAASPPIGISGGGTGASTAAGARTNLGLGTMATQNASAVAITGGTMAAVTVTGGTVSGLTTDMAVADGGTGVSTLTDGGVLVGNGTGAVQATAVGTAGHVLTSNGAGSDPTFQPSAAGSGVTVSWFRGEQSSGTNSGELLTSLAWTSRVLNATKLNGISGASRSGNAVTLPAGTYTFAGMARFRADLAGLHGVRLRNTTDGVSTIVGRAYQTNGAGPQETFGTIEGAFTIAATKTFELQSFTQNGLGFQGGEALSTGEAEVYVEMLFSKVA